MNDSNPLPRLARRRRDAHKGHFGHVLVVAGSRGMSGAAALAGMAAMRGGAGLVTLAVPDVCLETVAALEPSYMTLPLPCDEAGRMTDQAWPILENRLPEIDCVALGPGLGHSASLTRLVARLYREIARPMVIDAAGLNAVAEAIPGLTDPTGKKPAGPRILTPHPGEFRRLLGPRLDADSLAREAFEQAAIEMALREEIVIVLKGRRSLITDGRRNEFNETGNPGMGTGGSGDVLTGLIAALVGQGMEPWSAARLGCHVHGLAGDLAAAQLSEVSLIASDLIRWLPEAFRALDYDPPPEDQP